MPFAKLNQAAKFIVATSQNCEIRTVRQLHSLQIIHSFRFWWHSPIPPIKMATGLLRFQLPESVMPKPIIFQLGEDTIPLAMQKIDRTKLYGYKEVEVLDESEEKCELATLAEDGRTVVGKGGTAMAYLDVDGNWCERTEIKPINLEGDEITPVASSFSAPIELNETVSLEAYLEHNIRLMYRLDLSESESDNPRPAFDQLCKRLNAGEIFHFAYSYRGGLEADAGFLLANQANEVFFVVGDRSSIDFIGLQQMAPVATNESPEDSDSSSLMDFDMI